MELEPQQLRKLAQTVIETEASAISGLLQRIDESFVSACKQLLSCEGRIVVLGMGKSGHIANKIAATLASTGSPAFYVHPGEAAHGDLGMITGNDVVMALSNSGETEELLNILPVIKRKGTPLISITGNPQSTLAQESDVCLDVSVEKEACPLGLAPTSSTTAALVMGDALAIALLEARGFTAGEFALSHPSGSLGRRLLVRVKDIMRTGDQLPTVTRDTLLKEALLEISSKGLGMTVIVDDQRRVIGIFTDGDLRRALDCNIDIHACAIDEVMTGNCKIARSDQLAVEIVKMMEDFKINAIPVVDDNGVLIGALNMHDLLRAGVV